MSKRLAILASVATAILSLSGSAFAYDTCTVESYNRGGLNDHSCGITAAKSIGWKKVGVRSLEECAHLAVYTLGHKIKVSAGTEYYRNGEKVDTTGQSMLELEDKVFWGGYERREVYRECEVNEATFVYDNGRQIYNAVVKNRN